MGFGPQVPNATGGGGAPSGPAGGDLAGTYPNPSVASSPRLLPCWLFTTGAMDNGLLKSNDPTYSNTTQLQLSFIMGNADTNGSTMMTQIPQGTYIYLAAGEDHIVEYQINGPITTGSNCVLIPVSVDRYPGANPNWIVADYMVSFQPGLTPGLASVLTASNDGGNQQLTNISDPTTAQSAATKNYVDTTFAPLDSPALINNPTAPTQTPADNSTKLATTAYTDAAATAAANEAGAYTDSQIAAAIAALKADPTAFAAFLAAAGITPVADATVTPVTSITTVSGIVTADS